MNNYKLWFPLIKWLIVFTTLSNHVTSAQEQYQFTTDDPVYVIGDIDGASQEFSDTLLKLKMIDKQGNWTGGKAQIVSLGDLSGDSDWDTKSLDLFIQLQHQAESAGGRFHILLGDREFNLIISQLANEPDALANQYTQWLTGLPFVIKINDQVFAHGGLSIKLGSFDIKVLNILLKNELIEYLENWNALLINNQHLRNLPVKQRFAVVKKLEQSEFKNAILALEEQLLFSNDNPAIYRGNAICHPYFETDNLSTILDKWSTTRLWTGHSTSSEHNILNRLDNKLLIMNHSMADNMQTGGASIARIEKDKEAVFIESHTGETIQPGLAPNRKIDIPYDMTEEEIEEFLRTAEIIKREDLNVGVTKPVRMTLQKDDKVIRAVFKNVDSSPRKHKGKWKQERKALDRFVYDIAAYKIDRMLGIGLAPIAVERTIDNTKGAMQLWIDDLFSKKKHQEQGIPYGGHCDYRSQRSMMDTFDYLIRNTDRNKLNILYSKKDWQVWLIDHTRSFELSTSRPRMMKKHDFLVADYFKKALRGLTSENLYELKPWLHNKQIRAIIARRKKLLADNF